ncbi:MAG: prolipoprotein diacylglyceryl transferase, partial [Myxococcales bacterium]|nr:prolipoprotein diacylglyceryl transferase [Myxococcales bacterium]
TQLYGLLLAGATLAVAMIVRRRRRFSGQVFLISGITYLLGRSLVEEWFRADAGVAMLGPFNAGQVGSLILAGAMGVVLWTRGRLARQRPEAYRPWERGGAGAGRAAGAAASGASASGDSADERRAAAAKHVAAVKKAQVGKGRSKGTGHGRGPGRRKRR